MRINKCPNCGNKKISPAPNTEYVPMSLINPALIGLMLPKNAYCHKCNTQFELVDRNVAEYRVLDIGK